LGEIKEKVLYIKGLMDGLKLDDTKEATIIKKVLEVLEDVANTIEKMKTQQTELENYVESIDYDLGELEQWIYEEDDYKIICPNCEEAFYEDEAIMDNDIYLCPFCESPIDAADEETYDKKYNDVYEDEDNEQIRSST